MQLNGKQRRHLRALGHHLDPIVQFGKLGVTEGVLAALDRAVSDHELVKVRLGTECPDEAPEVAERIVAELQAEVVQVLGRTLLVFRRHPQKPVIALPGEKNFGKDPGEEAPRPRSKVKPASRKATRAPAQGREQKAR